MQNPLRPPFPSPPPQARGTREPHVPEGGCSPAPESIALPTRAKKNSQLLCSCQEHTGFLSVSSPAPINKSDSNFI